MQIISLQRYQAAIKVTVIDREYTIQPEPWMLQANSQDLGHKLTFFIERTEEAEKTFKEWMNA